MGVQRHERNAFYDLPVCCVICGQLVLRFDDTEPAVNPCPHTLYVAHDEAFEFLSERAEGILRDQGYAVERGPDGLVEVAAEDDSQDVPGLDELTDGIELPDALKVASYVGPPSGMGSYVGFAPLPDE